MTLLSSIDGCRVVTGTGSRRRRSVAPVGHPGRAAGAL